MFWIMVVLFVSWGENIMRFKKSLNNNIALAEDTEGCEVIVIGTGVGFKK
ncbi:CAT RNA binding domain-containing protein [Paenibacillus sp. OVF10]|nr:CAT RNA binding domain-containing protein [Paenibacillus sp. OVF10]